MKIHRNQREQQSYEVREVMARFGKQCQGVCADTRNNKQNDVRCRDEQRNSQHLGGVLAALDVHMHGLSLKQPSALSHQPSGKSPDSRGTRETSSFIRDNDVNGYYAATRA